MPTSHFDRSALPPPRAFYEREFGSSLGRERRGWAQTKCCFHDGQSKTSLSLNMVEGNFRCFRCGIKGGDVVKFVMLRENLDFKRAAQSLGAWRGEMTQAESKALNFRQQERDCQRADEADRKESERRERIEARDHLHAVQTLYEEAIAEHDWLSMSELLPRVRQAEEQYWQLAGLEVRHEC
jgi:DNA primase